MSEIREFLHKTDTTIEKEIAELEKQILDRKTKKQKAEMYFFKGIIRAIDDTIKKHSSS